MVQNPNPVYFGTPSLPFAHFMPGAIKPPKAWNGIASNWQTTCNVPSKSPWNELIAVTPDELATHTLLIGATGSGKTTLLHHLLVQDLRRGHSLVVLDLRGDLVEAALELASVTTTHFKVKIIDLREKERPFGFDPLWGAGEPYFRALGVLDVISEESESWGVQLAETLRNALLLLAESGYSLTDLEKLLYDRVFRQELLGECTTENVVSFWERFDEMSKDRQNALVMPVLNKVSLLLATKTLRQILGSDDPINLGAHLNSPGSVLLVSLAVDETHAAGRMMGQLVLASICREIFARVDIPEGERNPVRLYVDEFEHFGSHEFETVLAEGRRFKLSLVLAHQTLAQLTTKLRSMILGNVGMKFVFRCGREDGAVLSKDLTGDARSIDFAEMLPGQAVLWRRGKGEIGIDVNEPIIKADSPFAKAKQAFKCLVYQQAPVPTPPEAPPPKPDRGTTGGNLEDWLCD